LLLQDAGSLFAERLPMRCFGEIYPKLHIKMMTEKLVHTLYLFPLERGGIGQPRLRAKILMSNTLRYPTCLASSELNGREASMRWKPG
jgi:hypothetical protein